MRGSSGEARASTRVVAAPARSIEDVDLVARRQPPLDRASAARGRPQRRAGGIGAGHAQRGDAAPHVQVHDHGLVALHPGQPGHTPIGKTEGGHRLAQRGPPRAQITRRGNPLAHAVIVHQAVEEGRGVRVERDLPGLAQRRPGGKEALPLRQAEQHGGGATAHAPEIAAFEGLDDRATRIDQAQPLAVRDQGPATVGAGGQGMHGRFHRNPAAQSPIRAVGRLPAAQAAVGGHQPQSTGHGHGVDGWCWRIR